MVSQLPVIRFRSAGLPAPEAFEAWREFISPMYDARPTPDGALPQGDANCFLLNDVLVNRTVFGSQRVVRDKRRVDTTPDHIVLQVWRTGGYTGEVYGKPVNLTPGVTALADRRQQVNGRIRRADTVGAAIPRSLLAGLDVEGSPTRLDLARGRLLAAELMVLYQRAAWLTTADAPAEVGRLLAMLHRVFGKTNARDVLEGPEFDGGLFALAERVVLRELASSELTPERIAGELGVSRATLYRVFSAVGGVRRHVQELRLLAAREVLADTLDGRTLTSIAADHGFGSASLFSRVFRDRFGMPPSEWRRLRHGGEASESLGQIEQDHSWWRALGSRDRPGQKPPKL